MSGVNRRMVRIRHASSHTTNRLDLRVADPSVWVGGIHLGGDDTILATARRISRLVLAMMAGIVRLST